MSVKLITTITNYLKWCVNCVLRGSWFTSELIKAISIALMFACVCILGDFEEESKQPSTSEQQKHQLKHRELFLSRQFESLPATHIR